MAKRGNKNGRREKETEGTDYEKRFARKTEEKKMLHIVEEKMAQLKQSHDKQIKPYN